ncbi:MAG TPA: adenylate/guanylate cyclase domain-containing protein, partial [Desulfurivibrionaceae bacterium]|nr:adenylate/guanylate cyclase domain-containing protein [Desulfurivibrionaceae bacterium]
FGVPELHEDDAARAIDSALEFISSIRRPGSGLPDGLAFRTGVHTGLVTTGRRGDHEVVTGHTLAIASRLQTAAPANGILVSAVTREACEKQFVFAEPQELVLKGKDERVLAYQALARRKVIFDYGTPFVDRKQPLETLTGEYVRHMRGSTGGVYVLGDGGIGKTRLVAEFWARLKGFPGFQATFLSINPSLFGAFEYAAAMNAVADFLDLRPDATFEEFCAAVQDRTGLEEKWLKNAYGLFNPAERPAGESSFTAALAALFDAILASDGDAYPDVIFVDNARLMDESSMEFFRSYRNAARSRPFVVLCDRDRYDTVAGVFGVESELRLEPLSREDSAVLTRLLDPEGLDDEAVRVIVERSQGYPL